MMSLSVCYVKINEMSTRTLLFTVCCFLKFCLGFAQTPNYFILGETTLKNTNIYSVHQTKKKVLYVGTDQGLYVYRNYKMYPIENAKLQRGTAVFNLISDEKGQVFCSNLNGQVFQVKGNRLELIHQISNQDIGSNVNILIDKFQRIVIISKNITLLVQDELTKEWSSDVIFEKKKGTLNGFKSKDQKVIVYNIYVDSILILDKSMRIEHILPKIKRYQPFKKETFIAFGDTFYSSNYLDSQLQNSSKQKQESFIYKRFHNNVWRRGSKRGLDKVTLVEGRPHLSQRYFQNTFISAIFENKEGTLFLGTFGKGLYVIPDRSTLRYSLDPDSNIQGIATNSDNTIYISDIVNGIIALKNGEQEVVVDGTKASNIPENLFVLPKLQKSLIKNHPNLFFNNGKFKGAVKSIFQIDSTTLLAASSDGIKKWGKTVVANESDWKIADIKEQVYDFVPLGARCYDVIYDKENKMLYMAGQSSLYFKPFDAPIEEILVNDKELIVNDLEWKNGELWCATQTFGILVFKDRKIIRRWNVENGLQSNFITNIEFKNDLLFIKHKNGFQILNTRTERFDFIGKSEGVQAERVKDFALGSESIWFLGDNALISKPISKLSGSEGRFKASLDSIILGGKRIDKSSKTVFPYNQNELEIYFHTNDLFFANEAKIAYKLVGLDPAWKFISANNIRPIRFDYLPAGEYSFIATTILRGTERSILNFNFTIAPVFYQTWWFYLGLLLSLFGIVWYQSRLNNRKAKRKIKEQEMKMNLAESNLKAIRSQMNPHFIFNSLNAIQNLVLKNNKEKSYDYIVMFSEIVRNALEYSEKGVITLEQEIQFLKTYLTLEKLRFGKDLRFEISPPDSALFQIPALVIQPFVENALVHGLFHKKGVKELNISYVVNDKTLTFIIRDNGIGRKRAAEISKRQNPDHNSFAFQALERRMAMLRQKWKCEASFHISDITVNGEVKGTEVEVVLPKITQDFD